jgi:hypothetical protein
VRRRVRVLLDQPARARHALEPPRLAGAGRARKILPLRLAFVLVAVGEPSRRIVLERRDLVLRIPLPDELTALGRPRSLDVRCDQPDTCTALG